MKRPDSKDVKIQNEWMSSDSSNRQRSKGLIKKRDFPQINELIQESKNKKSNINLHPSDVSIAEIKALIRNIYSSCGSKLN